MKHEVLKLNSHCNCELEFNEIVEAVVLVYNDVVVERKKDKREERIRIYDRLDEMFERISEDYDRGQEEEDDDPIADLGGMDLEINAEGDSSDE